MTLPSSLVKLKAEAAMTRLAGILAVAAAVLLGSATPATAYAPPAIPSSLVARFDRSHFLDGAGLAVSRINLLAIGGSISTQLTGRPAGERWELLLYDAGTCDNVQHVVLRLPVVVIGSDGHRSQRVALTAGSRQAIIRAQVERARLVLRLSNGSYRTCRGFYPAPR